MQRSICFALTFFFLIFADAQKIFIGNTNTETGIYPSPGAYYRERDQKEILFQLPENAQVCCIAYIDIGSPYIVILYADSVGYVPSHHINVAGLRPVDLPRMNLTEIRRLYTDSIFKREYGSKGLQLMNEIRADSIAAAKQAFKDSVSSDMLAKNIVQIGFGILMHQFASDDYSVDFSVGIANYSKKTIKYIWFTVSFYNPVNDRIAIKTLQAVGPVPYNETAAYEFENALYTKVFDYGKITGVKIQYMDGTVKQLTGAQIKSVTAQN